MGLCIMTGGVPSVASSEIAAKLTTSIQSGVETSTGQTFSGTQTVTHKVTVTYNLPKNMSVILQSFVQENHIPVTVVYYPDDEPDGFADSNSTDTLQFDIINPLIPSERMVPANIGP